MDRLQNRIASRLVSPANHKHLSEKGRGITSNCRWLVDLLDLHLKRRLLSLSLLGHLDNHKLAVILPGSNLRERIERPNFVRLCRIAGLACIQHRTVAGITTANTSNLSENRSMDHGITSKLSVHPFRRLIGPSSQARRAGQGQIAAVNLRVSRITYSDTIEPDKQHNILQVELLPRGHLHL